MHSHERIDPRRGPGRERDDGRREIADGVTEYEEDREAERFDDYDSREDWGADEMDGPWNNPMADAHEPYDAAARISAKAEDDKIVIQFPVPRFLSDDDLTEYVEQVKRQISDALARGIVGRYTPDGHRIRSAEPTL